MHQAIAFAIASEFCRKLPFARTFCGQDEISAISFAKPFAFASELLRNAQFAIFGLRFGGKNKISGRVRIRIRIRNFIAAMAPCG